MSKKILLSLLASLFLVISLRAAEAWMKPYTEWSDDDRKKVANASPWSDFHKYKTGMKTEPSQASLYLQWQSAVPVKQLLYGRAAMLSDETALKLLNREEQYHVLRVTEIPDVFADLAGEKEEMMRLTVLRVVGKPDIHPIDVQQPKAGGSGAGRSGGLTGGQPAGLDDGFGRVNFLPQRGGGGGGGGFGGGGGGIGRGGGGGGFGGGKGGGGGGGNFSLYYVFAKDAPITVDDKEFEFSTKIGKMEISHKYIPKEMVYQGKFEW